MKIVAPVTSQSTIQGKLVKGSGAKISATNQPVEEAKTWSTFWSMVSSAGAVSTAGSSTTAPCWVSSITASGAAPSCSEATGSVASCAASGDAASMSTRPSTASSTAGMRENLWNSVIELPPFPE